MEDWKKQDRNLQDKYFGKCKTGKCKTGYGGPFCTRAVSRRQSAF